MKLINTDETLRQYIPNVLATVKGEHTLYDKLTPFLNLAEDWLKESFTSEPLYHNISEDDEDSTLCRVAARVVVCEAFRNAVPSLDLVLTPNGFGIVSNQNIAPASKERIERLIASLESERDRAIRLLLRALAGEAGWQETEQCEYFCATMFPDLTLCDCVGFREHQWQKYQELHPILQDIEQHIATQFLGDEQLTAFRQAALQPSSSLPSIVRAVISSLRAVEVQMVRCQLQPSSPPVSPHNLVQIVDVIRNHPEEFPEWHNSPISDVFSPPLYNNRKNDTGFWF